MKDYPKTIKLKISTEFTVNKLDSEKANSLYEEVQDQAEKVEYLDTMYETAEEHNEDEICRSIVGRLQEERIAHTNRIEVLLDFLKQCQSSQKVVAFEFHDGYQQYLYFDKAENGLVTYDVEGEEEELVFLDQIQNILILNSK